MAEEGKPGHRRTWGALVVGAVLVAVGIAWWSSDEPARERVEAVAGVVAVEPDPAHYLVEFDAGLTTTEFSRALKQVMWILDEDTEDTNRAPDVVVAKVGTVEIAANLTYDYETTAAVINTIKHLDPADVGPLLEPGPADITLREGGDVLGSARALVDGLAAAGVDTLDIFEGRVRVHLPKLGPDEDAPEVTIDDLSIRTAQERLDTLAQAIRRSDGTLLRAELDADQLDISVEVARTSEVAPTWRTLLDAAAPRTPNLVVRSPDLEIHGSGDPSRVIRFADAVIDAGAEIDWMHADGGNVDLSVDGVDALSNVVELAQDRDRWLLQPDARVAIRPPEPGFDYWMQSTDIRQLRNNLPLIKALWQAGYAAAYQYRTDLDGYHRHALSVVERPGGDAEGGKTTDTLVRILRTGRWPGTIRLEIFGDGLQGNAIAFSTTATGRAQDVADTRASGYGDFVPKWNATAR
ncbi:hypothetical protein [Actinophytocola sp.]|uniref:hypothetical protein n=1 Tax=Actinophytocola sp. TaxID=1872138 RepID=UPI003D6AA3CC